VVVGVTDDDDRPVYYNARPINIYSDPHPFSGVVLTFTMGDDDDHAHVELTMTEAEALDLAELLSLLATS
jgi:hypothetical protein